jgi:hypothetical protein
MNEALSITTTAPFIASTAQVAGPYFSGALDQLLASAAPGEVSTLSFTHAGIDRTILATVIEPFLNGLSAAKNMPRHVMVSARPGNADHLQKLSAAVRRALVDRDPAAAARAIKGLGSPSGWPTEINGI